jgi:PAS domain S-box-containing protein
MSEVKKATCGDRLGSAVVAERSRVERNSVNGSGSNHFVQFYETDDFLADSVASFVSAGITSGEGAVIIATPAHRQAIAQRLAAQGVAVASVEARGQYISLDAAETLSSFMVGDCPAPSKFEAVIAPVLERAVQGRRGVRAFGEMVALLWADGNHDAAIRLEQLWNELGRKVTFSLFCAYPMSGFDNADHAANFATICQCHSRVEPLQSLATVKSDPDSNRVIARLQQRASSLEKEIARREQAETSLRRREAELTEFVENASVGLHWVGPDGIIQWANKADYEPLGYTAEEYLKHHIAEFHADQPVIEDILARLTRGERLRDYEARLKCKDGALRTVLIDSCVLWQNGKFVHTQCFTRDITEQKRAEEQLRNSEAKLQTELADSKLLQSLSAEIVFERDMETLYQKLVDAAVAIMRSDFASMQMYYPQRGSGELRLLAYRGFKPEEAKGWEWVSRRTLSSCGEVLRKNRRVIATDIEQSAFLGAEGLAAYRAAGVGSMQSTPLFSRTGELVGMISTHWRRPHEPSERDMRLFDILARQAADVIEHRRAEMLLRESEERYRQLVSVLPAGVYACDVDGRITFYNRRAMELWGLEPELTGTERFCACYKVCLPDGTYVPPDQTPMAIAVREGKSFRNVYATVERPDGSRFAACVNIDVLRDAEGNIRGAINVFQDVTDQKDAEEQLRQSKQQLAADADALSRLNSLGSRLWKTSNLKQGIDEMLDATTEMLGADMGNVQLLQGDTLVITTQRGFKPDFLEFFRDVSATDESACGRALRRSERVIIADVEKDEAYEPFRAIARSAGFRAVQSTPLMGRDGKIRGIISTHWRSPHQPDERQLRRLDLYVRQAADFIERFEIEQDAARLAAIVEYSNDAIFSTGFDGRINSWNRGAERLYGYSSAEIIGQSLTVLVPEGRAVEEREIIQRIRRGESVENYETQRRRKDGTLINVSLTVSPVKDSAGNVVGVSKVARDITDKVRAREILERTVDERTASLREAVAQMEEFSYSVSHDLRAPE